MKGGGGPFIDPNVVKFWSKQFGILYFGCDIPIGHQEAITSALQAVVQQRECNLLVDDVVVKCCDFQVKQVDRRCSKIIAEVVQYLEYVAAVSADICANLSEFYLSVCHLTEQHVSTGKQIENNSADELWDLKEEHRFELEDLEVVYEQCCQKIRASTTMEELQTFFEEVFNTTQLLL